MVAAGSVWGKGLHQAGILGHIGDGFRMLYEDIFGGPDEEYVPLQRGGAGYVPRPVDYQSEDEYHMGRLRVLGPQVRGTYDINENMTPAQI